MRRAHGFDVLSLTFDGDGRPVDPAERAQLLAHEATDLLVLAHGFRNDRGEADALYDGILATLRGHLASPRYAALAARRLAVVGVYWPSKPFPEGARRDGGTVQGAGDAASERADLEARLLDLASAAPDAAARGARAAARAQLARLDQDADARQRCLDALLAGAGHTGDDEADGLALLRGHAVDDLLALLELPLDLPVAPPRDVGGVMALGPDPGGADAGQVQFLGGLVRSVAGRLGQVANLALFTRMKGRAGVVGATGLAAALRALAARPSAPRLHLAGHSLGARLVTAAAKALALPPTGQVASLTLLQAAFSHFGFSPDNGRGQVGFFRPVLDARVVRGPILATWSRSDLVVGIAYALSARLAGQNVQDIGDADSPFGGLGRNGTQRTPESTSAGLRAAGEAYPAFAAGAVTNLDGSEGRAGRITSHADVGNAAVTNALAAVLQQAAA
jgi:hypothetical protein